MKLVKLKYVFLITSYVFIFNSCNDILVKNPLDFGTPESYYNTPVKLEAALAGVYDILGSNPLYGWTMLYRH